MLNCYQRFERARTMTYEYACSSCSHEWEAEQSIKDDPLKECPACHKLTARRQISRGVGFILKGGGWYSDLYSSGSNKADGGADKSAEKASSGAESKEASGASKADAGASKPDTSSKADAGASKADAGASKADAGPSKTGGPSTPKPSAAA
jgi:putative FmdB family regulatory protein